MAMPQAERVAMGQVGVPTQGRAAGPPHAQLPMEDGLSAASQPPANAEQAVIAQADPTADDAKTNNAGAASRGKEPGFAGVEAQAQSAEFASRHIQRLEERLWPIRKESQIIHIAQAHPHSREAAQLMVKTIKVEVGQKLAGEVADGQAPGTLPWVSRVSPGKASIAAPSMGPLARMQSSSQRVPGQAINAFSWPLSRWWSMLGKDCRMSAWIPPNK